MIRLRSFVVVAVTLVSFAAFSPADKINILPMGDSITQGGRADREEYTYRYPLFGMLKDAGIDFDYIGSMKTGLQPGAKWPDYKGEKFDLDHEGHYGWKTAQVRDKLAGWMKDYTAAPDIALIYLGHNDQNPLPKDVKREITNDDYIKAVVEPLTDIVKMLREKNPKVVVLLAHIHYPDGAAAKIRPLVEKMATDLNTADSPIQTVHMYKGFIPDMKAKDSDTYDWAHPNPKGQAKLAKAWFDAMQPYFERFGQKAKPAPATQPAPAAQP